mmetsp:Transcript_2660/g.3674  ORF Transcript_2660/g.3674 Transcript_2660/m.3674 type:complete len:103 (-) Transcript_2660:742-1050(-)
MLKDEDGTVRIDSDLDQDDYYHDEHFDEHMSPSQLPKTLETHNSPTSPSKSSPHSGEKVLFGVGSTDKKRKRKRPRLGVTMYVKKDLTLAPLLESSVEEDLP